MLSSLRRMDFQRWNKKSSSQLLAIPVLARAFGALKVGCTAHWAQPPHDALCRQAEGARRGEGGEGAQRGEGAPGEGLGNLAPHIIPLSSIRAGKENEPTSPQNPGKLAAEIRRSFQRVLAGFREAIPEGKRRIQRSLPGSAFLRKWPIRAQALP